MHRIASTLTLGLLVAFTGCPGDDSTSSTINATSTSGEATSTGAVDTTQGQVDTTQGQVDTTMGTPGTTTDMPGTTTDMPGTTTDTPGTDSTTGGGGGTCDPDPMDDACATCVKGNCCSQLEACFADGDETMGCFCYQGCIDAGGGPIGDCDEQCGVNPFDMGSPTGQLGACTLGSCAADCPLG